MNEAEIFFTVLYSVVALVILVLFARDGIKWLKRRRTKRAADETICTCSHDAYENVVNPGHCMACGKPFRR